VGKTFFSRLKKSSGEGVFERINNILWAEYAVLSSSSDDPVVHPVNITTAEELDQNTRFGIMSHGVQADPVFNYANLAALELFKYSINDLCKLPSRYSTLPHLEQDRDNTLKEIAKSDYGYIHDGMRQTSEGRVILTSEILYWVVYDDDGTRIGHAAVYDASTCVLAPDDVQAANKKPDVLE
jgi:hypothetical protein